MESVVLVIHLFLALAIIGLVLLQRSEGGGVGIGGGGGGMGSLASARTTANLLTRATAICGGCFFATSLILAILAGQHAQTRHGILESLDKPASSRLAPSPEAPSALIKPVKPMEAPAPLDAKQPPHSPETPAAPIEK